MRASPEMLGSAHEETPEQKQESGSRMKEKLSKLISIAGALIVLLSSQNSAEGKEGRNEFPRDRDGNVHVEKATLATYEDKVRSRGIEITEVLTELKRLMDRNSLLRESEPKENYEYIEQQVVSMTEKLSAITAKTLEELSGQKKEIEKRIEEFRKYNEELSSISNRLGV